MTYVLTRWAEEDLLEIWHYIASDNETAADRLIDRLTKHMDSLAEMPLIGRKRDELRTGYRSFSVGNYLIFYRVIQPDIEIIHIVHSSRDLEHYPFES